MVLHIQLRQNRIEGHVSGHRSLRNARFLLNRGNSFLPSLTLMTAVFDWDAAIAREPKPSTDACKGLKPFASLDPLRVYTLGVMYTAAAHGVAGADEGAACDASVLASPSFSSAEVNGRFQLLLMISS